MRTVQLATRDHGDERPVLRGWLHLVCFFLAIPVAVVIVAAADTVSARVGASIYAVGLVALFGVSGFYHRVRWTPVWRRRMRNLDHTTIFVMTAGTYTPVCLVVLEGWMSVAMLAVAWTGAALGGVLAWSGGRRAGVVRSSLYIVLGWLVLLALPQLIGKLSAAELVLLVVGGVLFTVGAITLATRWPDPFPRFFGHHEVWHVFVVAAVVCHLAAILSVVDGPVIA